MTGEPTAPVPIPDLLAGIACLDEAIDFARLDGGNVEFYVEDAALIVRGVRDLAARVETLERALREIAELDDNASHTSTDRDLLAAGKRARAALAGQSTTEQS